MILRTTLFLSLVTIFYFYCRNDEPSTQDKTGSRYQLNVPFENLPMHQYELVPGNTMTGDSSNNYISASRSSIIYADQSIPDLLVQN